MPFGAEAATFTQKRDMDEPVTADSALSGLLVSMLLRNVLAAGGCRSSTRYQHCTCTAIAFGQRHTRY